MTVEFVDVLEETEADSGAEGGGGAPPERRAVIVPTRPLSPKARKKIMRRRQSSIRAYIGPNGSGKSALMVMDVLPVLEGQPWKCDNPVHLHTQRGVTEGMRRVLSTVTLLDPSTGMPHPLFIKLGGSEVVESDWQEPKRTGGWWQVLEAEHMDILFDEVTGIAGSRESMGMPVVVQNKLNQLRRADTPMSWSAPSWARADSIIRSCTQLVTDCRGFFPDRSLLKGPTPPAWLPRRMFKTRSFNAVDFDEWTAAKASQEKGAVRPLKPAVIQWWWGPKWFGRGRSLVFSSYDTYDAVSRVGEVLDGGRCADCGGTRARPRCSCD